MSSLIGSLCLSPEPSENFEHTFYETVINNNNANSELNLVNDFFRDIEGGLSVHSILAAYITISFSTSYCRRIQGMVIGDVEDSCAAFSFILKNVKYCMKV